MVPAVERHRCQPLHVLGSILGWMVASGCPGLPILPARFSYNADAPFAEGLASQRDVTSRHPAAIGFPLGEVAERLNAPVSKTGRCEAQKTDGTGLAHRWLTALACGLKRSHAAVPGRTGDALAAFGHTGP